MTLRVNFAFVHWYVILIVVITAVKIPQHAPATLKLIKLNYVCTATII